MRPEITISLNMVLLNWTSFTMLSYAVPTILFNEESAGLCNKVFDAETSSYYPWPMILSEYILNFGQPNARSRTVKLLAALTSSNRDEKSVE